MSNTRPVTNPLFKIAPIEYAVLSEQALQLMAHFEFDKWATMLAENVVYSFPDGDAATRTKLHGKNNLIDWWKNCIGRNTGKKITILGIENRHPVFCHIKKRSPLKSSFNRT